MVSPLIHFIFPSFCDLCKVKLKGKDFNRVCLRCLVLMMKEVELIGKNKCQVCFNPLKGDQCLSCRQLEKNYLFKRNTSLFYYQGRSLSLLREYKFNYHESYAKVIAYIMGKKYKDFLKQFDVIVPIRLGRKNIFIRQFCPVNSVLKKLLNKFNKELNLAYLPCIKRNEKKYTTSQHHKNIYERKKNIDKKYFFLKKYQGSLNHKKILIVDDVLTSGSTLDGVTQQIKKNNPQHGEIEVFTFFRTIWR